LFLKVVGKIIRTLSCVTHSSFSMIMRLHQLIKMG